MTGSILTNRQLAIRLILEAFPGDDKQDEHDRRVMLSTARRISLREYIAEGEGIDETPTPPATPKSARDHASRGNGAPFNSHSGKATGGGPEFDRFFGGAVSL